MYLLSDLPAQEENQLHAVSRASSSRNSAVVPLFERQIMQREVSLYSEQLKVDESQLLANWKALAGSDYLK